MSTPTNSPYAQAINRIKQARTRLRANVDRATKSGIVLAQKGSSASTSTVQGNARSSSAFQVAEGGAYTRENRGKASPRLSGGDPLPGSLGKAFSRTTLSGPVFRSSPTLPARGALFSSPEHEKSPPVSVASSVTQMPSHFERTEASISTRHGPGVRFSGTEYLGTIVTASGQNTTQGMVLFCVPISPQVIPDTRLGLAAQMFTRYLFRRARFWYLPTAPATVAGSLMHFADYDPMQTPTVFAGDAALRYAFAHGAQETSVWERTKVDVTDAVYADMLYCDPDDEMRWSIQGNYWVMCTGTIAAGTEVGKIVLEYEIDFAVPDYRGAIVSPNSASGVTVTVPPTNAGVAPKVTMSFNPSVGLYTMFMTNNPSGNLYMYANPRAYEEGGQQIAPAFGYVFFLVWLGTYGYLFSAPELYYTASSANRAMVMYTTTAASVTFTANLHGLASAGPN